MYLHELKEELILGKEMAKLDEVLERHPMFGGKLWEMINEEAGESHDEQTQFIDEHIELVAKLVEEDEEAKRRAQNDEPAGATKPASAEAPGSTSGDAEGESEHDPG